MLFLLLRLLTAPMPMIPAAATDAGTGAASAVRPDAAALTQARARQAAIDAGPVKIRALMRGANDTQFHAGCVAQRLAEAQVHVALARDEMQRLTDPNGISAGDRQHALRRLALIAERTQEVEQAARACVDDELSSISATEFETTVPPVVESRGDVTSPAPPIHPCPGTDCVTIPRAP